MNRSVNQLSCARSLMVNKVTDQGCALAEPDGPWCLTFALRRLDKSFAGHPRFYSFRALAPLQFSLDHSLAAFFLEMWHGLLTFYFRSPKSSQKIFLGSSLVSQWQPDFCTQCWNSDDLCYTWHYDMTCNFQRQQTLSRPGCMVTLSQTLIKQRRRGGG